MEAEKAVQKELEDRLQAEKDAAVRVNRELEAALADLKYANEKNKRMQELLDESRQVEAKTKQELGDLQVEYAEAMQREEAAQEEIRGQFEKAREQARKAIGEAKKMREKLEETLKAQADALKAARIEVEERLTKEHSEAMAEQSEELVRATDRAGKAESKLKLESEKRMQLELELRKLKADEQRRETMGLLKRRKVLARAQQAIQELGGAGAAALGGGDGDDEEGGDEDDDNELIGRAVDASRARQGGHQGARQGEGGG